ncbi:MAG: hypothetical protein KAJ58_02290 [Candidatus Pacebacteria bacterium]|nr:hypothetical protein [Candidatus Paceibacterota bacterium]
MASEDIPSQKKVKSVFKQLTRTTAWESICRATDKQGLYLWIIRLKQKEGFVTYSYLRRGNFPEGRSLDTVIHISIFDAQGDIKEKRLVAKLKQGKWKITP